MKIKIEWIGRNIEVASPQYRNAVAEAFKSLPSEMDGYAADEEREAVEDAVEDAVWHAFRVDAGKLFFDYDAKGTFVAFDWPLDEWGFEQRVVKIWYDAELDDAELDDAELDNA